MHCKECQFGVEGGGIPSQLLVTSLCDMTLTMATATFTGLTFFVRTDLLLQLRRRCYDEIEREREREKSECGVVRDTAYCLETGMKFCDCSVYPGSSQ